RDALVGLVFRLVRSRFVLGLVVFVLGFIVAGLGFVGARLVRRRLVRRRLVGGGLVGGRLPRVGDAGLAGLHEEGGLGLGPFAQLLLGIDAGHLLDPFQLLGAALFVLRLQRLPHHLLELLLLGGVPAEALRLSHILLRVLL